MATIGEVVDKEMYDENERLKERLVKAEGALRNLVAAAKPASNSLAILMNAIKAQPGSPVDEERIALNAEIAAAEEVLK